MINIASFVLQGLDKLAEIFDTAEPFRHLVMNEFFADDVAQRLQSEFPPFERGSARNEAAELGGKSTVERVRKLGPSFAALDELNKTPESLGVVSRITGIPGPVL